MEPTMSSSFTMLREESAELPHVFQTKKISACVCMMSTEAVLLTSESNAKVQPDVAALGIPGARTSPT